MTSQKVASNSSFCPPGWGHFFLEATDEKEDHVELAFACLAHQVADSVGKKYTERLYTVSAKGKDKEIFERLTFWAWKLGLVTEAEIDSGDALSFDFNDACGRQCVLHLREEKYKDKEGNDRASSRADYKGIYRVDDPEVAAKKVPLDHETLAVGGYKLPDSPAEKPAAAA